VVCAAAILALGPGLFAGCGDDAPPAAALTGTGQLELTYVPDTGVRPRTGTLVCPADGVDERQACEQLEGLEDPFAEVPADRACAMVYGGPEQITVDGLWEGTALRRTFTRTNGCETDMYAAVAPVLLPLVGGPGGG
jgi:hypothetical protein